VVAWYPSAATHSATRSSTASSDRAAAYASAIRIPGLLPHARLVVDHFHLVKLANDALTGVRRCVAWDLKDRLDARSTRNGPTGAGCHGPRSP
jgi:transposase